MPRKILHSLLATTALSLAAPTIAWAADAPVQKAEAVGVEEILVTARRQTEKLQDIPVAVKAITQEDIQNLQILSASDVGKLAPGLTLSNASRGTEPVVVMRGVRWTDASGSPAIPIYFNEVSFDPSQTLVAMYDVQQIEVLRGPQGTTRGAPSISGAVTITTHRPDLDQFGGFISGLMGDHAHWNGQAALNVPLVRGKVAFRVAGLFESSEGNGVRSVNSRTAPAYKSVSGRATFLAQPTDAISVTAMYQRLETKSQMYSQVSGTGSPGFTVKALLPAALGGLPPLVLPANYNGPAIATGDYRAVQKTPPLGYGGGELMTVNATWDVLGQRLSYNFGRQQNREKNGYNPTDTANMFIGFDPQTIQPPPNNAHNYTHELRLSSIREPNRFFDYDVGFYYFRSGSKTPFSLTSIASYLPGSFGAPLIAPSSPFINSAAVARYGLPLNLQIILKEKNYSAYGNVKFHLPYDFELSGGLRWIHDSRPSVTTGSTLPGFAALPTFLPAAFGGCPAPTLLPASPIYGAQFCDVPVPSQSVINDTYNKTFTPTIYNVSLSRKFTEDLMVYTTVGTSYRTGIGNIGTYVTDPNLLTAKPESATSYEVGVKSTWFENKVRLNADVFQIDYTDQLTQGPNIQYLDVVSNAAKPAVKTTSRAFFQNINARVRGVEAEVGVSPVRGLNLGANFSYAKMESSGGLFPCNDPTRPLTATNIMNFCNAPSGTTINASSPFQANFTGSYVLPVTDSLNSYVRFLVNHNGSNPNFGNDLPAKAYTLVDLFGGFTGGEGGWDIGFYAKNVFDRHIELTRNAITPPVADFGPTGYSLVRATLPREIGVTVRLAFGSR